MLNIPLFGSKTSDVLRVYSTAPSATVGMASVPGVQLSNPALPKLNSLSRDTVRFGQVEAISAEQAKKTVKKWATKKDGNAPPLEQGRQEEIQNIIALAEKKILYHPNLDYHYFADKVIKQFCCCFKKTTTQSICVVSTPSNAKATTSNASIETPATIEAFVRAPKSKKGSANQVLEQVEAFLKSQKLADKIYARVFGNEKLTTYFLRRDYEESRSREDQYRGNVVKNLRG